MTLCDLGRVAEADGVAQVRLRTRLERDGRTIVDEALLPITGAATTPRVIDDVDIGPFGPARRLHMTVRLSRGGPVVDRALALPGPVILR